MAYTEKELMATGDLLQPEWLTVWSAAIGKAALKDLLDLKRLGIDQKMLDLIEKLRSEVSALTSGRSGSKKAAKGLTIAQNAEHEEALDWWHDAKGIALQTFESEPAKLGEFRGGVRVGQSIPRLRIELKTMLNTYRKYAKELAGFGGTDAFIKQGDAALADLDAADDKQESERKALPTGTQELNLKKGELYVAVRRVVRAGRIVFRKTPGRAEAYSYEILRRGRTGAKAARTRESNKEKPAAQ
jgi:hypothetical protein